MIVSDKLAQEAAKLFTDMGLAPPNSGPLQSRSPIDGSVIGAVAGTERDDYEARIAAAHCAYLQWREVPPPRRGELVRRFGEELRQHKRALGALVSLESGKILSEGLGEVQEMIDICDFAVGLSRQLYGLTIATERKGHRMMETWHPLGVIGVISAFNFPVAVWAWNACLALVCGNSVAWKPSEKTPLCAQAAHGLFQRTANGFEEAPADLAVLLQGLREVGEWLAADPAIPLISATGSTAMGRQVGPRVAARFGRCLLELGGNNGMIVSPSADLDLAVRAIAFAAAGTAGQRCTSLRRLLVQNDIYDRLVPRLITIFEGLPVGDPRDPEVLIGPLIDGASFARMQEALAAAREQGGTVSGGDRIARGGDDAYYVAPAIVEMPSQTDIVKAETFAPILYVLRYDTLDEAIALHNAVPQGLSSSILTNDIREAEMFLSSSGSDCGIANVNIGPSGAEIGGAFGGEKETGGGRESGSDSWRSYMRRATNTINYSCDLPLAQGVRFDI